MKIIDKKELDKFEKEFSELRINKLQMLALFTLLCNLEGHYLHNDPMPEEKAKLLVSQLNSTKVFRLIDNFIHEKDWCEDPDCTYEPKN